MIKILERLKNAEAKLKAIELSDNGRSSLAILQTTIEEIESRLRPQWWKKLLTNPWFLLPVLYLMFLLSVFWLSPLWLLTLDRVLEPLSVKIPWLETKVGLRKILLFQYHPRVLDAWIGSHIAAARTHFGNRKTVKDREFHVPSPVVLDGKGQAQLSSQDLREVFSQSQARVLIWGEGGAGKTSLACLLARWAMAELPSERLSQHWTIPVLLEDELEVPPKTKHQDALLAMIRGQLQAMVSSSEPIPEPLFEHLLRQRRVLVIVDHLSEMNGDMQKAVRPELPDFPVNSLVVTARTENIIGTAYAKKIAPMRIKGDRTASFMEAYLTLQKKRALFPDSEFFDACAHLSRMVGKRNVTVLLARLYADRLIKLKEGSGDEELPANIPDLMLSYLNELNRTVLQDRLDERQVHKAVSELAWLCLENTFRPAPAARDEVLAAFGAEGDKILDYLEQRLRIVVTVGAARNQVRITLDPLAEYLAGIYLCEQDLDSEVGQKIFLERVRSMAGSTAEIEGFLLAVHDCYTACVPNAKDSDHFAVTLRSLLPRAQPLVQAA
jgi:HEAT repeat protein